MSKILPSGDTKSTVCNDIITKTLQSIRIGQQAGTSLKDIRNIIIGVNAGYSVNYINNCIFIGNSAGKTVKSGAFNIIIGKNYNDNNINSIITIGNNNSNKDDSVILGTENINRNNSNFLIGNNNYINGLNNYILGNNIYLINNNNIIYGNNYIINGNNNLCIGNGINIINNEGIILGNNSNIYGNKSIIIGNYNKYNSNSIIIGNNNLNNNNGIVIGNNIEDYRFSLNIDNTICKYDDNNNKTLFLGLGYKYNSKIPVLIGFNNSNYINLNKNSLYIKGGLKTDEIKIRNNSNIYISLKNNENLLNNIEYILPAIPKDNITNILLSSDANGNLNWLDVNDFQILHLILTGECKAINIRTNTISGDGSGLININLKKNTTDNIQEGRINNFYNYERITTQFDNFITLNSTDILNEGIQNLYYNYNRSFEYFLISIKYITTNNINQGTSNIYYTTHLYNKYINSEYINVKTDLLQEGTSNFFYSLSKDNYLLNEALNNRYINADYLPEGTSNLYFTSDRFNTNFFSNLNNITTNNLIQGTTNLFYDSNLLCHIIYATDNIKEGTSNFYLTQQKVNNIIDNFIKTTDNIKEGTSNLYYKLPLKFKLNTNNIIENEYSSNLYFSSNNFLKYINNISSDNILEGSNNLYFTNKIYNDNFKNILNNYSIDGINIGFSNKLLLNNNYYDSNLNILGTLSCSNINNIFLGINTEPNIGPLTTIKDIYDTNNVDIQNYNLNYVNINYNYYNEDGTEIINDNNFPFTVTDNFVGINTQYPLYNLDVNGIVNATEYIGIGSNITNINWCNINNVPQAESIYTYYYGNFIINSNNVISLKNIYSTNNNFPLININNNYEKCNNINNTSDYYYVFDSILNSNIIIFDRNCECQIFMIGGGGGGGDCFGGGGGAGSYYYGNFIFYKDIIYNLNIGKGGNGGIYNSLQYATNGDNTSISIYNSNILIVSGGGAGGGLIYNNGKDGGCGGGGSGFDGILDRINSITYEGGKSYNINGVGNNGGSGINNANNYIIIGGGGGGIGSSGNNAINNIAGDGGIGLLINIKGYYEFYGGGGGGGYQNITGNNAGYGSKIINNNIIYYSGGDGGNNDNINGNNGITSGGGGGGGGYLGNGGNGANGCIIIKFMNSNISKFYGLNDNKDNPSFTWQDEINTGIYHSCNIIGFSINGNEKLQINNNGIIADGGGLSNIQWSNINNIPLLITSNVLFEQKYITSNYVLEQEYINSNILTKLLTNYGTLNYIKNTQWSNNGNNIYYNIGNIGIGVSNPINKLDISGTLRVYDNINNYGYLTLNVGGLNNNCGYISFFNGDNVRCGYIGYQGITNYLALIAESGFLGYQVLNNLIINGNVGIGTTIQTEKVEIVGNVKINGNIYIGNKVNNNNNIDDTLNGTSCILTNNISINNINDKLPVLKLCRQGYSNIFGAKVNFNVSRWEDAAIYSRTKLDISLSHNSFENNNNIITIRSDGNIGINNTTPIAPLCIGDSSIIGNDGYLILTKNIIYNNRQIRIGYNENLEFVIGDYGYNNQNNIGWINQFRLSHNCPENSFYIDPTGNLFIYNDINANNYFGVGSNIKYLRWSNLLDIPEIFTSNSSSNITNTLLLPYVSSNNINNIIYNNNYITSNSINNILVDYVNSNVLSNIVINQGFLTSANIGNIIISGTTQWTTSYSNVFINYYNNGYTNVGIGTTNINVSKKFSVYGDSYLYGTLIANNYFVNDRYYFPKININGIITLPNLIPNTLNTYYYAFNILNFTNSIEFLLPTYCDILVVGGGGNGGYGNFSGGGGAGEVIYVSNYLMLPGIYNIIVGNPEKYSAIINSSGNLLFLALCGGTGGSSTGSILPTQGGSGGGGYGGASYKTGALVNNYWSCNYITGMVNNGADGILTKGGSGGTSVGTTGYLSSITGNDVYYGKGGFGAYIGSTIQVKNNNTGSGGDGNGGVGTAGTIIFKFNNNVNINDIYINSNNINYLIANNNYVNSNTITSIISPFVSSNIINKIIIASQWAVNNVYNNLYYNGTVGIGTTVVDTNLTLKVSGNSYFTGNLSVTNLLLGTTLILPTISQLNNLFTINNNYFAFTSTSSIYTIIFNNSINCDILVVGGGGNGGTGIYGGGGGGGEVIYLTNYTFNGAYYISVGNNNKETSIFNSSGYLFTANSGGTGGTYNIISYTANSVNINIINNTYIYWNNNYILIKIVAGIYNLIFNNGRATLSNANNIYIDNSYPNLLNVNNNLINPNVWYKFDIDGIGNDAGGYNNTLSTVNNPSLVSGIKGLQCANLDSSKSQYFYVNTINLSSKSFSIAFWVYLVNNNCTIVSSGVKDSSQGSQLNIKYVTNYLNFGFWDDDIQSTANANDVGNWVYWVCTYNNVNKTKIIYRNGILVKSAVGSVNLTSDNNFYIGTLSGTTNNFLNGKIDDFRIYYNLILTLTQINELYNGNLLIYINTSTSGGSGGGGSIYQYGALGGTPWNSNVAYGLVNNSSSGSFLTGGGGGGAVTIGNNNIGGNGFTSTITQNSIIYGSGGTGSKTGFLPTTKISNTGSGGDGNGGLGSSGIVVIKFNNNIQNINNVFISSNQIDYINKNYNYINSNILNNFLAPYVTSNNINNLVVNSQWSNITATLTTLPTYDSIGPNIYNFKSTDIIFFNSNLSYTITNLTGNYTFNNNNGISTLTNGTNKYYDYSYPNIYDIYNNIINPLVWYKFDNNIGINIDSSGNNYTLSDNDASMISTTTRVKGASSLLLDINLSQSLTCSTSLYLNGISFSISVWVYPLNIDNCIFLGLGSSDIYDSSLHIGICNNNYYFGFYGDDIYSGYYNDTNTWVFMVYSYDNSNGMKYIYRNGVLIASGQSTGSLISNNILVIGRNGWGSGYWNGNIDDLRVYANLVISQLQINLLYYGIFSYTTIVPASTVVTSNIFIGYNVGIGITSVPEKLNVGGNINVTGNIITNKILYQFNLPFIYYNNAIQQLITTANNGYLYKFTDTTASYAIQVLTNVICDVLIVGGGGNGGTGTYSGGGGGGEVIYISNLLLNPDTYYITVGNNNKSSYVYNKNNIVFKASSGGTGSSSTYNNTALPYSIFANKKPWGIYSAADFVNNGSGTYLLLDSSGNNRHATTFGTITQTTASGSGAAGNVTYIYGNTAAGITWPAGSIPTNFTICSITKYNSEGNRNRILQSPSFNWLHGHHGNKRGVAHYEGWITSDSDTGTGPINNWLVFCSKNGSTNPNNVIIDGIALGRTGGGRGGGILTINGNSEQSDWAFTYLIIWDQLLTDAELKGISTILLIYLIDAIPLSIKVAGYTYVTPPTIGGSGGGGGVNASGINNGNDGFLYNPFTILKIYKVINTDRDYYFSALSGSTNTFFFQYDTIATIFMIGGGGGGGLGHGGGGGAGAYCMITYKFLANVSYNVSVGAGGTQNTDGGPSSITIVDESTPLFKVNGGGYGNGTWASDGVYDGHFGGCGGGGAGWRNIVSDTTNAPGGLAINTGTNGFGYKGGSALTYHGAGYLSGGGGGGAGSAGGNATRPLTTCYAGNGGDAINITITGNNLVVGGGGAGSGWNGAGDVPGIGGSYMGVQVGGSGGASLSYGGNGVVNTGSGGGGGGDGSGGGGTGGSGIVIIRYTQMQTTDVSRTNSMGADGGTRWSSNLGIGLVKGGGNGSSSYGGGGGGALTAGNNNIGGIGYNSIITGTNIIYGSGGSGSFSGFNSSVKTINTGTGGDGNGGLGSSGIVVFKFYTNTDINNIYVSSNLLNNISLNNNLINTTILNNQLLPYITSNQLSNVCLSTTFINSNILNNNYISCNNLKYVASNIGFDTIIQRNNAIINLSNVFISCNYISSNNLNSFNLYNNFINSNILNNYISSYISCNIISNININYGFDTVALRNLAITNYNNIVLNYQYVSSNDINYVNLNNNYINSNILNNLLLGIITNTSLFVDSNNNISSSKNLYFNNKNIKFNYTDTLNSIPLNNSAIPFGGTGTRIMFYYNTANTTDYPASIGIDSNYNTWHSAPANTSYKWYISNNNVLNLYTPGILELINTNTAIPVIGSGNLSSSGSRIILQSNLSTSSDTPYSIGISSAGLWYCSQTNNKHLWYSGINNTLILYNSGILEFPSLPSLNAVSQPSFSYSCGTGTRILLLGSAAPTTNTGYAIGLETSSLWNCVPTSCNYKWYVGTTNILTLNAIGLLELSNSTFTAAVPSSGTGTASGSGTRIIILNTSDVPFAVGIGIGTTSTSKSMWYSVPTTGIHQWYSGTQNTNTIYNNGILEFVNIASGNINTPAVPKLGFGVTVSTGTRIILYSTSTDTCSIGVDSSTLWHYVPASYIYKWYNGSVTTNSIFNLYNNGLIENTNTTNINPPVVGIGYTSTSGARIILMNSDSTNTPYSIGIGSTYLWHCVPTGAYHAWYISTTNIFNIYNNGLLVNTNTTSINFPSVGISTAASTGTKIILMNSTATETPYSLGIGSTCLWYCVPSTANHSWYSGINNIHNLYSNGLLEIKSLDTTYAAPVAATATTLGSAGLRIIIKNVSLEVPFAIGIGTCYSTFETTRTTINTLWYSAPSTGYFQWYTGVNNIIKIYNTGIFEFVNLISASIGTLAIPTLGAAVKQYSTGTRIVLHNPLTTGFLTNTPYSIGVGPAALWNCVPISSMFKWYAGTNNIVSIYNSGIIEICNLIASSIGTLANPTAAAGNTTPSSGTRIILHNTLLTDIYSDTPYSIGIGTTSMWYCTPAKYVHKWYSGTINTNILYNNGIFEFTSSIANVANVNKGNAVAAPTAGIGTSVSTGTRIILFSTTTNTYSIGVNTSSMWYYVPALSYFQWYSGTTNIFNIYSNGLIENTTSTVGNPVVGIGNVASTGAKIILMNGSSTETPYALGVNTNILWYSVPSTGKYIWYTGTSQIINIYNDGVLEFISNTNNTPGAPIATTITTAVSTGTRIILHSTASDNYSIGVSDSSMWCYVPSGFNYQWYTVSGTTLKNIFNIYNSGLLEIVNAPTLSIPTVGNTGNLLKATGTRLILMNAPSITDVPYALGVDTTTLWYSVPSAAKHSWYSGTKNIFNIYKSGLLEINNTSTEAIPLIGIGESASTGTLIILKNLAANVPYSIGISTTTLWHAVPSGYIHDWYNGTVVNMRLDGSNNLLVRGTVTASSAISDIRLKENIKPLDLSLDIIKKLNPVKYTWKDHEDLPQEMRTKEDIGFIAQEIEKIIPESICKYFNYKGVRQEKIIPYLVKSIQILEQRILELENKNK